MLIIINLTGLSRTYWLPKFEGHRADRSLWYFSLRWLQIEVTVHGPSMGTELIRRFNRSVVESGAGGGATREPASLRGRGERGGGEGCE